MIETSRLNLRFCQLGDEQFVYHMYNQAECIRFIGDKGITDLEKARSYLNDNLIASYQNWGYGLYIMELKDTKQPIGLCGLVNREYLPIPDLGFALRNEFAGQGYAQEACKAVLIYCRDILGINELLAITKPDNTRSNRLLTSLGFKTTSHLHKTPELKNLNTFKKTLL